MPEQNKNKITIYKFPEDISFNVVIIFCGIQLKVLKIETSLLSTTVFLVNSSKCYLILFFKLRKMFHEFVQTLQLHNGIFIYMGELKSIQNFKDLFCKIVSGRKSIVVSLAYGMV